MSKAEFRAHLALIDSLWAEEVLRDRGGSLNKEQARLLTLMATGDKVAAQKAWLEAAKREVFRKPG